MEGSNPNLAEGLHKIFLKSMEARYKEVLSFLAFIVPSLTGFMLLLNKYEAANEPKPIKSFFFGETIYLVSTFFAGTIAILSILLWGAAYALALSYRYRYLQASVYRIEETCGADYFIPDSFKPKPLIGFKTKLGLSIAPTILQVHVFFFISCIIGVSLAFCIVTPWTWRNVIVVSFALLYTLFIYYLGAFHYPRKLNNIIANLDRRQ